ncbi:zinc metallopeptidase [Ructibacterium gallinarum]|uniref:Zinc metallopeptidase n=1 Tax=Ructibacterium gallinarum TaxID=2779355 RepID=A0A9D5R8L1_9FIRM|nr:zinc metallopeptidase [Ructibacterium gallinarum]MBE5039549.1 zinc metallopeptidase [Ructibacterium gallinarum]
MPYYFYYFDWTIILLIPAFILSLWAQANVNGTFRKYSQVYNRRGYTGADIARRILDMNGLYQVRVERVSGNLTDHFDPKTNVVRLSEATYSSQSVGAIGVAAHEVGHAVQHAVGYAPIRIRNGIVPFVNVCNWLSMPILLIGVLFAGLGSFFPSLIDVGIILFSATVLFQLVTLPVEFNASRRALQTLRGQCLLDEEEMRGASAVLRAAALTYVAAAVSSIMSLLRLILLFGNRRND